MPPIQTEACKTIGETITKCRELHEEIKQFFIEIGHLGTSGHISEYSDKISEIIEHMVIHSTYYRGNIAASIRQMGYEGTKTDYIEKPALTAGLTMNAIFKRPLLCFIHPDDHFAWLAIAP